jgi:hypothetical protein
MLVGQRMEQSETEALGQTICILASIFLIVLCLLLPGEANHQTDAFVKYLSDITSNSNPP